MKFRNGQSKQQLPKKPTHSLSFSNQALLNEMYDRVCSKQTANNEEFQNIKPLLSYLSISGQTSQVQQTPISPHFDQNVIQRESPCKQELFKENRIKVKKYSMQERIKTDMNEVGVSESQIIQTLRQQNQTLREQLKKCQKRIVALESYESQVEYLKKISYLQHNEIQKLRTMLKNIQLQKIQNIFHNFKKTESKSKSLKQTKNDRNVIVATEANESLEITHQKKPKCGYKESGSKKDKENDCRAYKTNSTFFQNKHKQSNQKIGGKGLNCEQKGSKLKNKKAMAKLE